MNQNSIYLSEIGLCKLENAIFSPWPGRLHKNHMFKKKKKNNHYWQEGKIGVGDKSLVIDKRLQTPCTPLNTIK